MPDGWLCQFAPPQECIVSPNELEHYLHQHIPLSQAMHVSVVSVRPEDVVLSAPLPPNINHRGTVFGGSASAIAILAAWSLLHARLHDEGIDSRLVIQRNTMHYERPIDGSFTARSFLSDPLAWSVFTRTLRRRGRARIAVSCVLEYAGRPVGQLDGLFVALGMDSD
ncbi:MAG: YiiD C-terminal domain-containing protein [Proteobacteria bacterium]|nr:YiiD C-terminal domain-containing protein [Pseudomonadota bacterium]